MIPDYDMVVVDEAHELVGPGHPGGDRRAVASRRSSGPPGEPATSSTAPRPTTWPMRPTCCARRSTTPSRDGSTCSRTSWPTLCDGPVDAARTTLSGVPEGVGRRRGRRSPAAGARAWSTRSARSPSGWRPTASTTWSGSPSATRRAAGNQLCVAPLQVWGQLRDKLLDRARPSSARRRTLKLGGDFTVAGRLDRAAAGRAGRPLDRRPGRRAASTEAERVDEPTTAAPTAERADATALPVARHRRRLAVRLPAAGASCTSPARCRRRDATASGEAQLDEIRRAGRGGQRPDARALLVATGGRGCRRGAARGVPHLPILCQGDGQLSHLQAEFVANPAVSLFGTLSLWQGLDVPGRDLPAGDHRPDPVPATRRPADVGASRAPPTAPAATASWRSRPRMPPCCSPRAPAG